MGVEFLINVSCEASSMTVSVLPIQSIARNRETSRGSIAVQLGFSEGNYIILCDKFTGFLPFGTEPIDIPSG